MSKRSMDSVPETTSKQHVSEDEKANLLFNPKLWTPEFQQSMQDQILNNKPFQWGLIDDLIDDKLLRDIRSEVETQIKFTEKETDIYKVNQSGDLANLSNLQQDTLERLPNLFKLQQILYSKKFRDFMAHITQSGPLSECKVDLSVNTYKKGCHLLVHDDVIGSRRLSFIIYLPDPDRTWKDHYGGGLRLFPAVDYNVPYSDPVAKLVPQFNQFAFFKIQPGYSWHDVEEVKVDKHRLSIQGWYHIPQVNDVEGFTPGEEKEWIESNDKNLTDIDALKKFEYPSTDRDLVSQINEADPASLLKLNDDDKKLLSEYLSPTFLQEKTIEQLKDKFFDNSFISVEHFLNDEKSDLLQKLIKFNELNKNIPTKLNEVSKPWDLARPPHKWQFLYLNNENINNTITTIEDELDNELINLQKFLQSLTFKKFIIQITNLLPITEQVLIRRFRPGFDYTLADQPDLNKTLDDILECVLEGTLSLTPFDGWEDETNGGYQLYMLNQEELREDQVSGNDSILINKPASWNSFTLVMRDSGVLEFIKYVSFNSKASRWDIKMSWDVKDLEEDDEEEEKE